MRTLSLFSGIGGLDLGLERAGFEIVAAVEIEPYPQAVLAERFPDTKIFDDVREVTGGTVRSLGGVDAIVGGFPCQDVSSAGAGAGLDGERSGLWFEMLRVIREVEPLVVVAENVPALRARGSDRVLEGLHRQGYAGGAFVVGARDVLAPHRRDRVFILGIRDGDDRLADASGAGLANRRRLALGPSSERAMPPGLGRSVSRVDHTEHERLEGHRRNAGKSQVAEPRHDGAMAARWPTGPGEPQAEWEPRRTTRRAASPLAELGGGAYGVPDRLLSRVRNQRLKALGNAVVPQVGEIVGRAVLAALAKDGEIDGA